MLVKRLRFSLACFAIGASISANAQNNLGTACGCPPVSVRDVPARTVNLSTKADVDGNLLATNTVLSCDTLYILNDKIYVGDGKTLTINPGTVVKAPFVGVPADENALIVSRGGKIFAPGTESCPIVFTSTLDPMNGTYGMSNRGKWGGVVLLGRATNNLLAAPGGGPISTAVPGVGFIEGFTAAEPRNLFGMPVGSNDDNDNSGIMTYVSIRHAGAVVAAANELNGLTLGSVGRGTTLSHIEVAANADDGVEFFGGTVDLKYASVVFSDDDGFDYDLGWKGRGQFWVQVKTDATTAAGGDNGFECDGDDGNAGSYYAIPNIYNATCIGSKGINGVAGDNGTALELKEATRGIIRNCVFANFTDGMTLNAEAGHPSPGDAYALWASGAGTQLIVENNTFINCTNFMKGATGAVITPTDTTNFLADGNTRAVSLAGFSPVHVMNMSNNTVSTKHDLIPGADIGPVTTPPVDGFFSPVTYRGAFKTGQKSWLSDYTINALVGLEGNLIPCITDINTDGNTNTSDFLLLLGAFGTSCQ